MPHDRDGQELKVGDRVDVPCRIVEIQQGQDFCNVRLVAELLMPPDATETALYLNAKQVQLKSRQEAAA